MDFNGWDQTGGEIGGGGGGLTSPTQELHAPCGAEY